MFDAKIYVQRRAGLKKAIESGLLFFLGNDESPMNYTDNPYHFRQDSSFLYYWGLDNPGLAAIIDIDGDKEMLFGDDLTVEEIVWMGPQPTLRERSLQCGVRETGPSKDLEVTLKAAVREGRAIHFLPQYRSDSILKVQHLLGIHQGPVNDYASKVLTKAVIDQRAVKKREEIEQIEAAIAITYDMQTMAMRESKAGMYEREVAGAMEGIAVSKGGNLAFPIIFSVHGETLHNHFHGNKMKSGDIVVNDSGAESSLHYASDITRTFPVGGRFSERQKDIYRIVLSAQEAGMRSIKPGVKFKDVHILMCKVLASGLRDLGLMRGDLDEAVNEGAHALFFQCGSGHMMGLDVHDMENLGEDLVGYGDGIRRSEQFGLRSLRLAKALQPDFVVTVEPGLYFIPQLIDAWKASKKLAQFVDYQMVEKYRDFGGIRVEDDVLVVDDGYRLLGKIIPKTIEEVEGLSSRQ
ncbi:MAG: aminopeptidase P family protein [Bacteroidota bacterium]